jgi:MFS family permease
MVLSIFLIGFGVGQFVMGPLSDRFCWRARCRALGPRPPA